MPLMRETTRSFDGSGNRLKLASSPGTVRVAYGREMYQYGDLRRPEGTGPYPLLVVFHGGFWRSVYTLENINPFCSALVNCGYAVWNVEYRRIGNWGSGWPGTFQDIAAAIGYLDQLVDDGSIDLERVVLVGHSSGGTMALWAAALLAGQAPKDFLRPQLPPLKGVISLAGISDLRRAWEQVIQFRVVQRVLGGPPAQYPERYEAASPIELLPFHTPQILIHGLRDTNVPYEMSQCYALAAQASGDPVSLISLPDIGHGELVEPKSHAWAKISQSVADLLS